MRLFIKDYISKITISDITQFGISNDISLSMDEADILLFYLKNNWEDILYGDYESIIHEIEDKFDYSKAHKIINLFYYYRDKYKIYL